MGYKHGKFWRHGNMVTAAICIVSFGLGTGTDNIRYGYENNGKNQA